MPLRAKSVLDGCCLWITWERRPLEFQEKVVPIKILTWIHTFAPSQTSPKWTEKGNSKKTQALEDQENERFDNSETCRGCGAGAARRPQSYILSARKSQELLCLLCTAPMWFEKWQLWWQRKQGKGGLKTGFQGVMFHSMQCWRECCRTQPSPPPSFLLLCNPSQGQKVGKEMGEVTENPRLDLWRFPYCGMPGAAEGGSVRKQDCRNADTPGSPCTRAVQLIPSRRETRSFWGQGKILRILMSQGPIKGLCCVIIR